MSNPYTALEGGGRVSARDVIKMLNDKDEEVGDLPPDDPAYEDLRDYLPMPDDPRVRFVNRYAPDVVDVKHSYLKLALSGEWRLTTIAALEALKFQSPSGHPDKALLPLVSMDPIDFRVPDTEWVGYGQVFFNWHETLKKFYSRVKFINEETGQKVAAYWCWP